MKNIFIGLFVLAISTQAFADIKENLRTLNCKGTVSDGTTVTPVKLKITDYKITYKDADVALTDYGTKATVTNPQDSKETLIAQTTNDGSEDPQPDRDRRRDGSWAGLSFFDLNHKDVTVPNKMNRIGLLILGSKRKPADKTKRNYDLTINIGELQGPGSENTKSYVGTLSCDLKNLVK